MINWKEIFEEFLKEHNAWEAYNEYREANIPGQEIDDRGDYFLNAFVWDTTEEGHNYWGDLNEKWWDVIIAVERLEGIDDV